MEFEKTTYVEKARFLYTTANNMLEKRGSLEIKSKELARHYFNLAGMEDEQLEEALQKVCQEESQKTESLRKCTKRLYKQWRELDKRTNDMIKDPNRPHTKE